MKRKQNLYLVFGGKLSGIDGGHFKNVDQLEYVGIFEKLSEAKKKWKSKTIKSLDDAIQCYKVVPLNHLLDPTERVFEYLQKLKKFSITMDNLIVSPDTTLKKVCFELKKKNLGSVLIMQNGILKGIFTEKDLVNIVSSQKGIFADHPVKKYMTKKVITIEPKVLLINALEIMKKNDIRHLPVYDYNENNLYGVISYKDFTLKTMN